MKKTWDKKGWLDHLFYDVGKQACNFWVMSLYKTKTGEQRCRGKWRLYMDAQEDDKFMEKVNNRTILDTEVVLDYDPPDEQTQEETDRKFEIKCKQIESDGLKFLGYPTGSRGHHIHLLFSDLRNLSERERKKFKNYVIKKYGAEELKDGSKAPIALEYSPHWKTGTLKEPTRGKGGDNSIQEILEEMEELQGSDDKKKQISKYVFDESLIHKERIFPFFKVTESVAAFGMMIPKDVPIYRGKSFVGTEQMFVPVAVTSDHNIWEVGTEFQKFHKIKFSVIPGDDYFKRWSLSSIEKFLLGEYEQIHGMRLFVMIRSTYEKFLYFQSDVWYKVHALWDLCTYFFLLCNYYPLMELRGMQGTAKSKIMTVSRLFSFNASEEMTNPSEPTLFRETHEKRPTKYIDEAERLYMWDKGKLIADPRAELINSGYKYTGSVPRQEKIGQRFRTVYFKTYSPTMIGSINGLYGATEDRAIVHTTVKPPKGDERGRLEPNEGDPLYQQIRDECYVFALQNWNLYDGMYRDFDPKTDLANRELNVWKSLLVLAKMISEDLYVEIKEFAEKSACIKATDTISEESLTYKLLKIIYLELLQEKDIVYLQDVINALPGDPLNPKTAARHIDKLGFAENKTRKSRGVAYEIPMSQFKSIVLTICPDILTSASSHTCLNREEALSVTEESIADTSTPRSSAGIVAELMRSISDGKKVEFGSLLTAATAKGISEEILSATIEHMRKIGEIHEQPAGFLSISE